MHMVKPVSVQKLDPGDLIGYSMITSTSVNILRPINITRVVESMYTTWLS